jgi:phosphoribosylglycinamide formyltransferase 1
MTRPAAGSNGTPSSKGHHLMRIALLTSTHPRHEFYARYLASRLPVSVVVMEEKSAEPTGVGQTHADERFLASYFNDRVNSEISTFDGTDVLCLSPEVLTRRVGPNEISDQSVFDKLIDLEIDTVGVFGTSLIRGPLLSAFPGRVVNIHLGLSPYYRGAATNFWAMYNEELHMVGATIHYLDPGVDTGEIICHVRPRIRVTDSPHDLGNRAIGDAIRTVSTVFSLLDEGTLPATPQWEIQDERVYRRRDFTTDVLRDFLKRFEDGLVGNFLESRQKGLIVEPRLIDLPGAKAV